MHRIERQIAEPRLRVMLLDERHRFACESFRDVSLLFYRLGAAQNEIVRIAGDVQVVMRAPEEAKEFIEAALQRMKSWLVAEVGFPEPSGRIARSFQSVCDRLLMNRESSVRHRRLCRPRIKLVSETLLI